MRLLNLFLSFLLVFSGIPAGAWDQANSKVLQVDQGSGISSVPNYWKSGDAEVTLTGVAAYADATGAKPVDCSGGSPAITIARTDTAPMYDKLSWLITKPASNVQGQGVAFEFDVDNGISQVEMMDLMFEYIVGSGTFAAGSDTTNSDIMVYLYDVTAGKLIEPYGGSKLYTSATDVKGDYRGWFQSTLGSKKYRVCLHQATTSASAYSLKVDAGKVQKSKQVVGTPKTNRQTYTPVITTATGTMTNYTATGGWYRDGFEMVLDARIVFTGSPGTWAGPEIGLPAGYVIDFGNAGTGSTIRGGILELRDSGTANLPGHAVVVQSVSSTKYRIASFLTDTSDVSTSADPTYYSTSTGISQTYPFTFASGDEIVIRDFRVPIQGWSAGARMSDGYDGRVVSAYGLMTSQQTGINTNNTQVKIQLNTLGVTALDTVGGFDFANNRYIFKSGGSYTIGAGIELLGTNVLTNTYVGRVLLTRAAGGSTTYPFDLVNASANIPFSLKGDIKVNVSAGDYIELYLFGLGNNASSTLTVSNSTITHLSISKDSGTSFMSPTALWETHYAGTAGDAIGTTDSLIKFTTKVEDTFGSYNPATGLWTAKGPATCSADARIQGSSVNMSTTQSFGSALRKDGAAINNGTIMYGAGVSRVPSSIISASSIKVVQGTTLSVYAYSDVATTAATSQTSNYFTVSCRQSGN